MRGSDLRSAATGRTARCTAAEITARICAERVGIDDVDRQPPPVMASEDRPFMPERVLDRYLHNGNGDGDGDGDGEGGCEVHNPGCDFNDAALPLGAAFYARLMETRLAPVG